MNSEAAEWTAVATSPTDRTVSAYEAKTHLSALLERAGHGETITITKHGHPIARLVPIDDSDRAKRRAAIAQWREQRKGLTLGPDFTIRQLIEEGRRY